MDITDFFDVLPWYLEISLIIAVVVAISSIGLYLTRSTINLSTLRANHDVAGFTFGIIGVMYGVTVGFTVVNVQEHFNDVDRIVTNEANILLNLFRDAEVFPAANRNDIRKHLMEYCETVINVEWEQMEKKEITNIITPTALIKIWRDYYKLKPQNSAEEAWYRESIGKLNLLDQTRLTRLYSSMETQGAMMWTLLILGAGITIAFMFFFGIENLKTQLIMTAFLATLLIFMLYMIYSLDSVFYGNMKVEPTVFQYVLESFKEWDTIP